MQLGINNIVNTNWKLLYLPKIYIKIVLLVSLLLSLLINYYNLFFLADSMLVSFYEDVDIVHVYEKLITIADISSVLSEW